MLKKVSKIMFIAMLVFSLVGSFTTAFAGGPPEDKASKSQACQNASDNGKSHANGNSVLGDCTTVVVIPVVEPPVVEPPADEPDPCLDLTYFFANLGECAV